MESKPPNIQFQLECVRAFMTTFRQHCPRDFVDASNATAELRRDLITEEYKEWQAASPMSDELLDALVDLQYVTLGSFLALGVKYINKPPTLLALTNKKIALDAYVAKALWALNQRPLCRDSLQPALSDLADAINQAGLANGFDMAAAFSIVHNANMDKRWMPADVKLIPADATKYHNPDNTFTVYNKAGKVIKPPGFRPPNLTPILMAALRQFESATSAAPVPPSSTAKAAADPCPAEAPPAPPAVPAAVPQSHSKTAFRLKRASKTES